MNCAIWTSDDHVGHTIKHQLNGSLSNEASVAVLTKDAIPTQWTSRQPFDVGILHLESSDEAILDCLKDCCENLPVLIFLIDGNCKFLNGIQAASLDYFQWPVDTRKAKSMGDRLLELHSCSVDTPNFVHEFREALKFMVRQKLKRIFEHIVLPHYNGYALHKTDSLMRFESEGPFCYAFSVDGGQILAERSIRHFEDALFYSGFVRIDNAQLINLRFLKSWSGDKGVKVTLADDAVYAVSLRRVPLFLEAFSKWSTKDAHSGGNNRP